jgi:hypothetical protein
MFLTCPWQARTDPILSLIYPIMDASHPDISTKRHPGLDPASVNMATYYTLRGCSSFNVCAGSAGGRVAMTIVMVAIMRLLRKDLNAGRKR